MTIGLCGSHRVGKTSLARAFAEKRGIPFVETSVSAIWRELGFDPAAEHDFATRLMVQEEILKRVDALYGEYAGEEFITDRTPIDMAAYTLADAIGDRVPPSCQKRLKQYVDDCFEATNKRLGIVLLVQPGIPLVDEPGKAPLNDGYIEHLNSLILGLTVDERLSSAHYYMPRTLTDMQDRLIALQKSIERTQTECHESVLCGAIVH